MVMATATITLEMAMATIIKEMQMAMEMQGTIMVSGRPVAGY